MRDADLAGAFQKELNALVVIERAEGGSSDGESIEIWRRLDLQRCELGWHGQDVR
jgi:hypothetical protein